MAVAPARVWRCWTEPKLIEQWFAPKPVIMRDVVVDLWPGGEFSSRMILPDGTEIKNAGTLLIVEPERRLVFTDCLGPGFRPKDNPFFSAEVLIKPDGDGTLYTARAIHGSAATRDTHAEMGFHQGWGTVAAQLEAVAAML